MSKNKKIFYTACFIFIGILGIYGNFFYDTNTSSPKSLQTSDNTGASKGQTISGKAGSLYLGITYGEVVQLLGRKPDTVVNDQIRAELGEPVQGNTLIRFGWRNDNSQCAPVSVDFDSSTMKATGWDKGLICNGESVLPVLTEPFGKACSQTTLCN